MRGRAGLASCAARHLAQPRSSRPAFDVTLRPMLAANSLPVYLTADVRRIEALAGAQAHPPPLMERAGLAAAELARDRLLGESRSVLVLAGPGNNGGDGFVLARHLKSWWYRVAVVFTGERARLSADAGAAHDAWLAAGGTISTPAARWRLRSGGRCTVRHRTGTRYRRSLHGADRVHRQAAGHGAGHRHPQRTARRQRTSAGACRAGRSHDHLHCAQARLAHPGRPGSLRRVACARPGPRGRSAGPRAGARDPAPGPDPRIEAAAAEHPQGQLRQRRHRRRRHRHDRRRLARRPSGAQAGRRTRLRRLSRQRCTAPGCSATGADAAHCFGGAGDGRLDQRSAGARTVAVHRGVRCGQAGAADAGPPGGGCRCPQPPRQARRAAGNLQRRAWLPRY